MNHSIVNEYKVFLLKEYEDYLGNSGFSLKDEYSTYGSLLSITSTKSILSNKIRHYEKDQYRIYLHISQSEPIIGWFWRDSNQWLDTQKIQCGPFLFFTGEKIYCLDKGISGGTLELLKHFLSKTPEKWLIRRDS